MTEVSRMVQTSQLWHDAKTDTNNVSFSPEKEKYQKSRNEPYPFEELEDMKSASLSRRKTILLLRGSSYSLVELPTFLPASCIVQTSCQYQGCHGVSHVKTSLAENNANRSLAEVLSSYQLSHKTMVGTTSQWTVMFVAILFFTSCLLLVGFMLSITSQYQDIHIARVLNTSDEEVISLQ